MTSANPYSPPQTDVRDAGSARLFAERPRQISSAFVLLWVSLALSVVSAVLELRRSTEPVALGLMAGLVVLAVAVTLNLAIWRGRNWARIVYMILTVLVIIAYPYLVATEPGLTRLEIAVDVTSLVLDVGIVYLLFTKPGSLWFRSASDRGASR